MRILITGIAGFIGSNLAIHLLNKGYEVIGLDNFSTGFQHTIGEIFQNYPQFQDKFKFVEGDIRDYDTCLSVTQQIDAVLHQAALGSVPRSLESPHISTAVNVTGFVNILTAAQKSGVSRFVYASSSSVYGDAEELPKKEIHKGNILSPYALTKAINEYYGEVFDRCYNNMSIIGLRYFNVFGPRQSPKGAYAAVIPLWVNALINNNPTFINGDGQTSRDFTYIENVVNANIAALNYSPTGHKVYNIAAGGRTTLIELFNLIKDCLGKNDINPVYREFRPGDIRHSYADISKAQQDLGYQPTINVREGINKTVSWHKKINNKSGLR